MLDVPRSDEIPQSKRKNLALTGSIVSLFFMPNELPAQASHQKQTNDQAKTTYMSSQTDPYLLYNNKDINTEYPNRDIFFQKLIDSFTPHTEVQEKIETKPQVVPLSFAKKNVKKYFPERADCFDEIISKIQQNPQLAREINKILNQTIMKPTRVHKETNPRPSGERDKVCGIMCFLEGSMEQNKFAHYINQRDKLAILSGEPDNRQTSDTLKYETRLAITDQWIMPGEMMQRVLDADNILQNIIQQQKSGKEIADR